MSHPPASPASAGEPLVSFRGVRKSFGSLEVLRGIDLEVLSGQVVALIGRSGSGKSTALRCINALEPITGGELRVCGYDLHREKPNLRLLRQEVGIVFQSYNLFPHLTAAENITLAPRKVKKLSRDAARELAREVLEQVGLADRMDSYPEQLSGGQQQRVAIARSLAMRPKLMLFDEVTSALDPELTGEVLRVIGQLAASGMTMVIVTHEMAFARQVADVVVYMHEGRVHEMGPGSILVSPRTEELKQFVGSGL